MGLLLTHRHAWVAPISVALLVLIGVGCSSGDDVPGAGRAQPDRMDLAGELEGELRAQAAAAGVQIPEDLRPSEQQLAALADGEVSRAELERQTTAFLDCLAAAGFDVSELGWDEAENTVDYAVGTGRSGEEQFRTSPFLSPKYVRCYGEHTALTQTMWQWQQMPSASELRAAARKLLECAADAGHELSTVGELQAVIVSEAEAAAAESGADEAPRRTPLFECLERFPIRTKNAAEMEQLASEVLR